MPADATQGAPARMPGASTDANKFRQGYLASQKAPADTAHRPQAGARPDGHASRAHSDRPAPGSPLTASADRPAVRADQAKRPDAGRPPGAADPSPEFVKFQQALIDTGLRAWVQYPTPFEKGIAGNKAYQDVIDPKSGQVLGYRHPYTFTNVNYLEIIDRNGKVAWSGTTGERPAEADAVSPVDILTGINPAALGAAAERMLAQSAGKAIADAVGSALGEATSKVAVGDAGKVLAADASKAAAVDAARVLATDATSAAATDASKIGTGYAAKILTGDASKAGTGNASKVAAQDASNTPAKGAARASEISEASVGGKNPAGAGNGGAADAAGRRVVVEKVLAEDGFHGRQEPDPRFFSSSSQTHYHVIDQYGRPLRAEGWLRTGQAVRTSDQDALADHMFGKLGGTEASHGIGRQFGGDGRFFNLTPLPRDLNQGPIKQLETVLAGEMKNGSHQFYLQVYSDYAGKGLVPSSVKYRVYVNDSGVPRRIFEATFYASH